MQEQFGFSFSKLSVCDLSRGELINLFACLKQDHIVMREASAICLALGLTLFWIGKVDELQPQ